MNCNVSECDRTAVCKGMCKRHYDSAYRPRKPKSVVVCSVVVCSVVVCSVVECEQQARSSGMCKPHYYVGYREANREKLKAYQATYRQDNSEKLKGYYSEWSASNSEKLKESQLAYRQAHLEENRARALAWASANPERVHARIAQRRRQLVLSPMSHGKTIAYRKRIKDAACYYCDKVTDSMHDDHFYPVVRGGTDHWFNIVRACESCNHSKHARLGSEFERLVRR